MELYYWSIKLVVYCIGLLWRQIQYLIFTVIVLRLWV